jgi:hypothetical protein
MQTEWPLIVLPHLPAPARHRSALSLALFRAPLSQAMGDSFGERITPAGAIKQILGSYPFSVGLFRELLQNSDDARASTQVRSRLHIVLRSSIL